uniref:Nucleoporin NUP42 n=1 Tax=Clastoptera arizonana TaxID=38151 RepID=A0A1B6D7N8_9HEMI
MVVCKYFSQGYCKFGSRCRFEHVRDSECYGASSYSTSWNPLGNLQSNENPEQKNKSGPSLTNNSNENSNTLVNKISLNDLVLIVSKDTLQLEEGNQWPLTCYAPIKECGNIPNWVDNSPEELRWKLYNSLKNGTYSTCKEAIDNLYREAEERRMNLKSKEKASNTIVCFTITQNICCFKMN